MTKNELVKEVASKTGLSAKASAEVMEAVIDTIKEELIDGGEVKLSGFGNFSTYERAARDGVNPLTGEKAHYDATTSIKFKVSKKFKDEVNM